MVGKSRAALSPCAYSTSSTLKFTVDFPFGIGINSLGRLPLVAVQTTQKNGNFQPGEFNEFVKGINQVIFKINKIKFLYFDKFAKIFKMFYFILYFS